jgi:hypothetical protein
MADITELIFAGSSVHVDLVAGQPVTETGNAAAVSDFSTADRLYALLQLHRIEGEPEIVVTVQSTDDSSDEMSWTDLITFSTATADLEEYAVAEAPDTYLRAAWTLTGEGSAEIAVKVVASPGLLPFTVPTSDPAVVGEVWNDSGTLKVSAGP